MEKPPLKQLPGGPDPSKPVEREPVAGHDLASYARISTLLSSRPAERSNILAEIGQDELGWAKVEQTWGLRIATSLLQGDQGLISELEQARERALDECEPDEPPPPLAVFAELTARVELGQPMDEVLTAGGLTLAQYMRMQRSWAQQMASSGAVAAEVRAAVLRERVRLSPPA